ncbi:MAG TPA: isoprenyl transferase [Alphaproteobacteria bacterium]|nr:isoprenyl transferase [Alphaproteobacteria bacterium]
MPRALPSQSQPSSSPVHVAIIMDGNGRWAKSRGLPRAEGHRRGVEAARNVVRAAPDLGISYLTLFGFSSENWQRPQSEVRDLMGLLRLYLRNEVTALHKNGARLRVIGDRSRLSDDIRALIDDGEALTEANTHLQLIIALSYGARAEIVSAARALAEAVRDGRLDPAEIDETAFNRQLLTADIPDPDLLIRTSGELRLSNFLLWQCAYTELVFTDRLWPDFDRSDLEQAIEEFHRRERRYGASSG